MKSILSALAVGTVLSAPTLLMAASAPPEQTQASQQQAQNWLGLALAQVPPALSAQLGTLIPPGRGVLVQSVTTGSPAAQAGLQANDVILSYDDQKLFAPKQLAGLVRTDAANQTVTLQAVQKGQLNTIQVTLGQRPQPKHPATQTHPGSRPFLSQRSLPVAPPAPVPPHRQALAWDSFESVQVRTLPDGRYHAEVSYKGQDTESRNFTFEGSRDEVIAQINQQQDLPNDKKQALLSALNLGPGMMHNFPRMPGGAFNDPRFNPNFFNGFPPMQMPPQFRQFFQPESRYPEQAPNPKSSL